MDVFSSSDAWWSCRPRMLHCGPHMLKFWSRCQIPAWFEVLLFFSRTHEMTWISHDRHVQWRNHAFLLESWKWTMNLILYSIVVLPACLPLCWLSLHKLCNLWHQVEPLFPERLPGSRLSASWPQKTESEKRFDHMALLPNVFFIILGPMTTIQRRQVTWPTDVTDTG